MKLRIISAVGIVILLGISLVIGYSVFNHAHSEPTQVSQNNELIATPENLKSLGLNFKEMSLDDPQRTGLITKDQALSTAYQGEERLKNALRYSSHLGMIQSDNQEVIKLARPVWLITFHGIESISSGPPGSAHYRSDVYTVVIDAQKGEYLFAFPIFDLTPLPLTTTGLINRQEAVDAALKIASSSQPEISGALVTPQNVQTEQMTLGEAEQRIHGNPTAPSGHAPEMPVWYVTMDGLWANEVSAPDLTPSVTQQPYHSYRIILDARTGLEIESSLQP